MPFLELEELDRAAMGLPTRRSSRKRAQTSGILMLEDDGTAAPTRSRRGRAKKAKAPRAPRVASSRQKSGRSTVPLGERIAIASGKEAAQTVVQQLVPRIAPTPRERRRIQQSIIRGVKQLPAQALKNKKAVLAAGVVSAIVAGSLYLLHRLSQESATKDWHNAQRLAFEEASKVQELEGRSKAEFDAAVKQLTTRFLAEIREKRKTLTRK